MNKIWKPGNSMDTNSNNHQKGGKTKTNGETHDKTCGKHINNKTSRERNIWTPRIIKDQHIPKYINTNQNISVGFSKL